MLFISDGSQGSHKHCLQVKFHIMPYNLQEDKHFLDKCGFLLKNIPILPLKQKYNEQPRSAKNTLRSILVVRTTDKKKL